MARHVDRLFDGYLDGRLAAGERLLVEGHLRECLQCRRALEDLQVVRRQLSAVPRERAPADTWEKITARLHDGQVARRSLRPTMGALAFVTGLALLLVLGRNFWNRPAGWPQPAPEVPSLAVTVTDGACQIDETTVADKGRLREGEELVTGSGAEAVVAIAAIGEVTIAEGSKIELVRTRKKEHRLRLVSGALAAKISAPPRLFVVETTSATAVDLGCEYTLSSELSGYGLLDVKSGWVMLEGATIDCLVPAGARCTILPSGRGIPYFKDADLQFVAAVELTETGDLSRLIDLLTLSRAEDALTLWHVLPRCEGAERKAVFDHLRKMVRLPKGVGESDILRLDKAALQRWRDVIEPVTDFKFWKP